MRMTSLLLAASLALAACGRRDEARTETEGGDVGRIDSSTMTAPSATIEELDVEDVTLGRRLNTDNTVADATDDFGVRDTIIAVVKTEDAAPGQELVARWTFGDADQAVAEQTQRVASGAENARTVFRLTKGSAWPKGDYHLRIMSGTKELAKKDFEVK
jgi:hypothetical protein